MFKKTKGSHSFISSLMLVGVAVMIMVVLFSASKQFMAAGAAGSGNKVQNKFNNTSAEVPDVFANANIEVRNP